MIYHGKSGLDDLDEYVRQATNDLKSHRQEFDSIAVTGMSGVLVGAPVALRLRKPLVVLRKASDDSHSAWPGEVSWINLDRLGKRVLFLDDFIDAGTTRKRTIRAVRDAGGKVVAEYLYRPATYRLNSDSAFGAPD